MLRTILTLVSGLIVASLAACGPSPTASSPSAAAKSTPTPGPIAACTVLTSQDASQLAGVTFAGGKEAGLTCTYTSGDTVVLLSIVQAANSAAVQAALQQQQQTLGANGFTQTQLSGADSAYEFPAAGSGSLLRVIEVVRGNIFFVIEALGAAPSDTALKAAATAVLSRLP